MKPASHDSPVAPLVGKSQDTVALGISQLTKSVASSGAGLEHTVICFVSIRSKFGIRILVGLYGTLDE